MMIATMLATTLMMLCPLISAIPGYALSPLVQHAEQCTHALSTIVQLGDTTPWSERTSDAVHESTTLSVSAETSLIVYDTSKMQSAASTCPVASKPSRAASEVLLTIEGPVTIRGSNFVGDASKTRSTSIESTTPVGISHYTTTVYLTIGGPISTKAGGKGVVNTTLPEHLTLPTCAATNGHPPTNQTFMMAVQQSNIVLSELEATLAPQGFDLASLLSHGKSPVNKRDSKANNLQSP